MFPPVSFDYLYYTTALDFVQFNCKIRPIWLQPADASRYLLFDLKKADDGSIMYFVYL